MFVFASEVAIFRSTMQVAAMMAQQRSVYTHKILCHNTFVNFIEFFCIGSVHIELSGCKKSRGGSELLWIKREHCVFWIVRTVQLS